MIISVKDHQIMPEMHTTNRSPLANEWNQRRSDGYDVVVIGSGYGAAVTAARLATAQWPAGGKPTICILERGREWLPGQFPDTLNRGVQESRGPLNPLGLYDNTFSPDIGVLAGSGLGGTSLVNANVAIRPDGDVFERAEWPQAIRMLSQNGQLTRYNEPAASATYNGAGRDLRREPAVGLHPIPDAGDGASTGRLCGER
jgi:cholesterol oxidase